MQKIIYRDVPIQVAEKWNAYTVFVIGKGACLNNDSEESEPLKQIKPFAASEPEAARKP